MRVLGVLRTKVKDIQPGPKFYDCNLSEGIVFLGCVNLCKSMTARYSSVRSLIYSVARTVPCGNVSGFVCVWGRNNPTLDMVEAIVCKLVLGNELVDEEFKMGSDA